MSKRKLRELFAKRVCAHAGSVSAAALCLARLLPVFLLGAAFVPEAWFLQGLTALVLVAAYENPSVGCPRLQFFLEGWVSYPSGTNCGTGKTEALTAFVLLSHGIPRQTLIVPLTVNADADH